MSPAAPHQSYLQLGEKHGNAAWLRESKRLGMGRGSKVLLLCNQRLLLSGEKSSKFCSFVICCQLYIQYVITCQPVTASPFHELKEQILFKSAESLSETAGRAWECPTATVGTQGTLWPCCPAHTYPQRRWEKVTLVIPSCPCLHSVGHMPLAERGDGFGLALVTPCPSQLGSAEWNPAQSIPGSVLLNNIWIYKELLYILYALKS